MAHFLARELKMRPYDILNEWTVEEIMVAYGEYANIKSKRHWEMTPPKERAKKHMLPSDRWAVVFVSLEDALRMSEQGESNFTQTEIDLQNVANMLL